MNSLLEQAEKRHRRMHSLITVLQFLNKDVDLHEERFETLEELREYLPTVDDIQAYLMRNPSPH